MATQPTVAQAGTAAMSKLTPSLAKALARIGTRFEQNSPNDMQAAYAGSDLHDAANIAGVATNDPRTIHVMAPATFAANAPQLLEHEGLHQWQESLPPSIQASIPPDNPADPYNYGGDAHIAAMAKAGQPITALPREQQSAAMQYYNAQGGASNPKLSKTYGKLERSMEDIPLSSMEPTDPNSPTLNTTPRAPGLPAGVYMAQETYKKGDPPPGTNADGFPIEQAATKMNADGFPIDQPATPRPSTLHEQLQANTEPLSTDTGSAMTNIGHFGQNILRRGARTLGTPVADALESTPDSRTPTQQLSDQVKGATDYAAPMHSLVSRLKQFGEDYKHDPNVAVSNIVGDAGATAATAAIAKGTPELAETGALKAANAVEKTGDWIGNRAVGTQDGDMDLGANPGRAVRSNRMVAGSRKGLAAQVKETIPNAADARNAILDRSQASPSDVSQTVNDPFNTTTSRTTNPRTGVVQPGQQRNLITMQRAINEVGDPMTGAPSGTPKDLSNLTPREISDLASNIYQSTDYSSPDNTLANSALKQSGYGLKQQLDQVAPEAAGQTQNLHDLMQAKDTLAAQTAGSTPLTKSGVLSSLVKRGAMLGGTMASAGTDVVGSLLRRVAGGGVAPPPMSGSQPSTPTPAAAPPQQGQYPPTAGPLPTPAGPGTNLSTQVQGPPQQPPSMAQTLLQPTIQATSTPRALPGLPPRAMLPAEAGVARPGGTEPPPVNEATARTSTNPPPPIIDRSIPSRSYTAAPDGSVTITRPALQPPGSNASGVSLAKQVQAGRVPMAEQPIPEKSKAAAGGSNMGGPAAKDETSGLLQQVLKENQSKTDDQGVAQAKGKGRIKWNLRRQVGG